MRSWLGRFKLLRLLAVMTRRYLAHRLELRRCEQLIAQQQGELEMLRSIVDREAPGLSNRIADAVLMMSEILDQGEHDHDCDS